MPFACKNHTERHITDRIYHTVNQALCQVVCTLLPGFETLPHKKIFMRFLHQMLCLAKNFPQFMVLANAYYQHIPRIYAQTNFFGIFLVDIILDFVDKYCYYI